MEQARIYKSKENLGEGGNAKALHFNEKVMVSKKNFMLVKDRSAPPPQPTPGDTAPQTQQSCINENEEEKEPKETPTKGPRNCLLYTSDAADE